MAALGLLERITAMPEHEFWPEDLPLASAISETRPLVGHRQVTDAYLVALAGTRDGVLATLDRGVMAIAGEKMNRVELL
jgi:predicted nucleic acid-binding protein